VWTVIAAVVLVGPVAATGWRIGFGKPLSTALVVLGVASIVAMGVAVVAPSRLRSLTATFGIDRIIGAHRWLGILAIVAGLAHFGVVVYRSPKYLNPLQASPGVLWGWIALAAMLVVGAVSRVRRTGRGYEWWVRIHVLFAAGALVLAGMHVYWLGDLLEDPVMRVVLSALALGLLAVLFLRWVWRPLFSRHGAYVVYGVRHEGPSVATLVLAPVHLRRGMRFHPGQFVWLRLGRSVLGRQEHPFTIASSAQVTGRLELTVRGSGDFSTTLAELPTGAKVWLDGPHGSFTADEPAGPGAADGLVLLAGGVGITPMMSMLRTLAERGDERTHHLVIAQRPEEPLFHDELASLERRLDLRVTHTDGRRIDAALLSAVLPHGVHQRRLQYFVCGSPSVTAGSLAALEQLAVPADRIHTEQFGWSGPLPTARAAARRTVR
jgi:predicted ferric reductase